MGDISPRLSRFEFRCRCKKCSFQTVDIANVDILEDCADHFQTVYQADRCFIIINSGCRCREYNEVVQKKYFASIGKVYLPWTSKSRHMWGDAVDFEIHNRVGNTTFKVNASDVSDWINEKFPKSLGHGRYVSFTHIDQGPFRRW